MHELVAGSSAWRVRAAKDRAKVGGFAALHGFIYTTRANISHEIAEQIRARIVCTPAERGLTHMRSMCVGVAETGVKAFLFLSFSFFSDKRKEHQKKSIFMYLSKRR
mgnify:CR=1 FL=1